jgi:hypothetical protein
MDETGLLGQYSKHRTGIFIWVPFPAKSSQLRPSNILPSKHIVDANWNDW